MAEGNNFRTRKNDMAHLNVLFAAEKDNFFVVLEDHFKQHEIYVKWVDSPSCLISQIAAVRPVAVILNCLECDAEDLTRLQRIRVAYSGPLVIVSNTTDIHFQVLSLQFGADSSWTLSENVALVAANIDALLRRSKVFDTPHRFESGKLVIDKTKQDGFMDGEPLMLSTIEFQILWVLVMRQGEVVSREEIHAELYHGPYNGYDRGIDLYISRIRQKIGDDPLAPKYLKTIRGSGYQCIGTYYTDR